MVQTGDPKGDGTGGQSIWHDKDKTKDKGTGFKNEITPYLYNIRGALSMANTGQPNTNAASSHQPKLYRHLPLNSLQASILRKSSKPTKKGETLV